MRIHWILHFSILVQIVASTLLTEGTEDAPGNEDALLARILRDVTGQYHPELHGDLATRDGHIHVHSQVSHVDRGGAVNFNSVEFSSSDLNDERLYGYSPPHPSPPGSPLPPGFPHPGGPPHNPGGSIHPGGPPHIPPPSSHPPMPMDPPNGYATCGCLPLGHCPEEVIIGMPALLRTLKNDVKCGLKFELCCYDDPWAGPIDQWANVVPCEAEEVCIRPYGSSPYDIQNHGAIGPCLGLGSVRCLDEISGGPTPIVIPIYDYPTAPPPTPTPPPPPPPTTPPVIIPPPTEPPIYVPPPVVPPPTEPPSVYEPPPAEPPTIPPVYEPPPPTVYEPPGTYNPPEVTYTPPQPPVETYQPPVVVDTPVPVPVDTYQPPVDTYEPPTETYEPPTPVDTYEPPGLTYGVPPRRLSGYHGSYRYPYYGGYRGWSRYPGSYGFRKRLHFSVYG